jgi:hypothetical protein
MIANTLYIIKDLTISVKTLSLDVLMDSLAYELVKRRNVYQEAKGKGDVKQLDHP